MGQCSCSSQSIASPFPHLNLVGVGHGSSTYSTPALEKSVRCVYVAIVLLCSCAISGGVGSFPSCRFSNPAAVEIITTATRAAILGPDFTREGHKTERPRRSAASCLRSVLSTLSPLFRQEVSAKSNLSYCGVGHFRNHS